MGSKLLYVISSNGFNFHGMHHTEGAALATARLANYEKVHIGTIMVDLDEINKRPEVQKILDDFKKSKAMEEIPIRQLNGVTTGMIEQYHERMEAARQGWIHDFVFIARREQVRNIVYWVWSEEESRYIKPTS